MAVAAFFSDEDEDEDVSWDASCGSASSSPWACACNVGVGGGGSSDEEEEEEEEEKAKVVEKATVNVVVEKEKTAEEERATDLALPDDAAEIALLVRSFARHVHCRLLAYAATRGLAVPSASARDVDAFDELRFPLDTAAAATAASSASAQTSHATVLAWVRRCVQVGELPLEAVVLALIFFERALARLPGLLAPTTFRWALLAAAVVACKVWEDDVVHASDFADCAPASAAARLTEIERPFLRALAYDVEVSAGEFFEQLAALRTLQHGHAPLTSTSRYLRSRATLVHERARRFAERLRAVNIVKAASIDALCPADADADRQLAAIAAARTAAPVSACSPTECSPAARALFASSDTKALSHNDVFVSAYGHSQPSLLRPSASTATVRPVV